MWERFVSELTKATQEIVAGVGQFLPRLMVMLIIVGIGWAIAYVAKSTLRSLLRLAKFDKISEHTGAAQLLNKAALPTSTELLSRLVFWVAWIGFILIGVSVLGIVGLQEHVGQFLAYLPRVFVALFVLFAGLLAASFFSRAALLAAVNADLPSPGLISSLIRVLLVVCTVSMFFEELGLGERTILVAFALLFGALMLGLAIAFGLGGKDLARQFLERRFDRGKDREKDHEDELSPL